MKRLSKDLFDEVGKGIIKNGRQLEKLYYEDYFNKPCSDEVLLELKNYQNDDGGFGKGLELDFQLPASSPMATSMAFQYLSRMDDNELAVDMIKDGIQYFEKTFVDKRRGWFAVPREVNDYPHAPWWDYNLEDGMTIIDRYWGNPSAEIIGYLYKYQEFVTRLDVNQLVEYALEYINEKKEFESFHEIYCYIALYNLLPDNLSIKMKKKLNEAVKQLVTVNRKEWNDYVAKPLDFISNPGINFTGISQQAVEDNLDYWVELLEQDKEITPNWEWNNYPSDWEEARKKWTGVLTLKVLIILDKFDWIDC